MIYKILNNNYKISKIFIVNFNSKNNKNYNIMKIIKYNKLLKK